MVSLFRYLPDLWPRPPLAHEVGSKWARSRSGRGRPFDPQYPYIIYYNIPFFFQNFGLYWEESGLTKGVQQLGTQRTHAYRSRHARMGATTSATDHHHGKTMRSRDNDDRQGSRYFAQNSSCFHLVFQDSPSSKGALRKIASGCDSVALLVDPPAYIMDGRAGARRTE